MPDSAAPSWAIVEKGPFVFAECRDCGWLSHGRRAYASAHKEGARHAEVCAADNSPEPAPAPAVG